MKTKTLFSALLSLCLFFAFSASSAYADDLAGYQRIRKNRYISIYYKIDLSDDHPVAHWHVVNHGEEKLGFYFRVIYYYIEPRGGSGEHMETINKTFYEWEGSYYYTRYFPNGISREHIANVDISMLEIKNSDYQLVYSE